MFKWQKDLTGESKKVPRFLGPQKKWISDVNQSVKKFQQFAIARNMSISEDEFKKIYEKSDPFIIQKCCDFTSQLRSIAEKAGSQLGYNLRALHKATILPMCSVMRVLESRARSKITCGAPLETRKTLPSDSQCFGVF